ncbi:MAG: hypothetical protein Ta2D_14080 [Rickettsiales bacterium]|nr:MAG: hypothetical protein Ta2D_14080 [Rickettsiales bacterium]
MKKIFVKYNLFIILIVFILGSCELFKDPLPFLVVKNESSKSITKTEIWSATDELIDIEREITKLELEFAASYFTNLSLLAKINEAGLKKIKIQEKICNTTTADVLKDHSEISIGGSSKWEVSTDKYFVLRVNGDNNYIDVFLTGTINNIYYILNDEGLSQE